MKEPIDRGRTAESPWFEFGQRNRGRKPRLNVEIRCGVLRVSGCSALTAANADRLRERVRNALDGCTAIEIDLSQVTYMDCAGLGALVALSNMARGRQARVCLLAPAPALQRLFDLMRVGHLFEFVEG